MGENTFRTRRNVLGTLAVSGVSTLAGCPRLGIGSDGDTGDGDAGDGDAGSRPLVENLVQHYRFDGSSFPCEDLAGDATASPVGEAELGSPGRYGTALKAVDGGVQWAVEDAPDRREAAVTVSFWMKTLAGGLPGINLVYRSALEEHFINVDGTTAQFVFDDGDDVRHKLFLPESEFNDGGWHHFVQRWDGTTHDLWLDGTRRASKEAQGTTMSVDDQPGAIGVKPDLSDNYPCIVDDFRVYSRAVSDEEVSTLYSAES